MQHCICREGITYWMREKDICPHCGGSLVTGPWAGDEITYGGEDRDRVPQSLRSPVDVVDRDLFVIV